MALSMYKASVPVFVQTMTAMQGVLDKGAALAATKKIEPAVFAGLRLYPDMNPLSRQVQTVSDQAKGCIARLAGVEIPAMADTEVTVDELKARLQKTIDFIKSVPPDKIDGTEGKKITLTFGTNTREFTGLSYLMHFTIPNFMFHATMTYALLRGIGVEVGKRDFMGSYNLLAE
jgi:uncharacterized protein